MKENEDVILKSDEPFSIKFLASAVCTKGLLCNISGKNLQKKKNLLRYCVVVLVLMNGLALKVLSKS